ncbi:NADPH:quinone reductase [Lusitaniella coriacea]|uniref:NADPH:quinone reductase n=1 Tax=Lusitaniella coriacea TaxID=1983105 RepID=UPI003CFA8261
MEISMSDEKLMQAAWYEQQGAAQEVIKYGEMPIPQPGNNEVRVKVSASGVNPSDTKVRSGWGGIPQVFDRIIPHQDGTGVIESVGDGVKQERIGERVWIYEAQRQRPFGTAAEYVVVPSKQAVTLPDNTSFVEGACLGVPAMTAHRAVFADGSIKGKTILVTGGAGAVGNYAIQLAKWGGAKAIATVSRDEQAEIAKTAGADNIINYKTEDVIQRIRDITKTERGIDRVVDVNFTANLPITSQVVRPNGVITTYSAGDKPDAKPALPALLLLMNAVTIRFVLVYIMSEENKQSATRDITKALEAGALQHNIARRFSLTEVATAHDFQDSGQGIGKAIIEIT